MESKKTISDKSKVIIAKNNSKKTTGKALQMNKNSADDQELYEQKNENIIQQDEVAGIIIRKPKSD